MARVRMGTDDSNDWVIYGDDFLFGKVVEVPDDLLADLREVTERYHAVQNRVEAHMKEVGYYDLPYDSHWPEGS